MLLPIIEDRSAGTSAGDAIIKTISSRVAGGRRELNAEPSRVCSLGNLVGRATQTVTRLLWTCGNFAQRCRLFYMH
jgi:hypothetical protein